MSKFKPGDIALITAGPCAGNCVELMAFHDNGNVRLGSGCLSSEIKCPSWVVRGEGLQAKFTDGKVRPVRDGIVPERNLMPLRGDFQPEQQKAREEEPCH